jgi:hypothetical protein
MIPTRFINLDAARARFGDRVDRLAPYLLEADPLADAVVLAMEALPKERGWAMLGEALANGIDAVPDAPDAMRALFAEVDRVPPWVDWATLDAGGELLMRAGAFGGMVLGAKSLVMGFASPGGNKPLMLSGRLTQQAARRLDETARFVQAVCRPGGMRRGGDGFHITVKVRLMHAQVRRMILRSGAWDEARWGAPINQHDMAGTTLLFSLSVLEGLRALGLVIPPAEAERYLQLWRYVARVMGCDHDLVPCSELEAWQLAELIAATMGPPDEDSRALTAAMLEAPLTRARTPKQMRSARMSTRLGQGLVWALCGDATAAALAVPRTPFRHSLKIFRSFNAAAEQVRMRVPSAHRAAVESGHRFWDRVVQIGLAGATAEFRMPERLARAA